MISAATIRTLVLVLLAGLALAAPASASRTQTTSFEAPRELQDAASRPAALDEIQGLGVNELRVVLLWKRVAPGAESSAKPDFDTTDPAGYDWGGYDALLSDAKARGMKVLLTVSGPVPRWATEDKKDFVTRPDPAEFAQFMTAVGRHFATRVATWSVWNEPNQPQFLAPQCVGGKDPSRPCVGGKPFSPRLYRALYKAALKGLAAAKVPSPRVLIGETSPRGTGKVVAPLTFLRGAMCLDAKDRRQKGCGRLATAGVAHHAYTTSAGPRFAPSEPNDVTIAVLSRLTRMLDRAGRAGAVPRRLPLHLTEFGIQSAPDPISGVSLQRQDEYRSLSERIAYSNPRVASFSQYLLRDDEPRDGPPASRYSGFESGLRTSGGKAKPALDGFRLPLSAARGSRSVSLWGLVRPATGVTTAQLESRSGSRGAWRKLATVRSNAAGYFRKTTRLVGGRQYRVTWVAPDGARLAGAATRPVR